MPLLLEGVRRTECDDDRLVEEEDGDHVNRNGDELFDDADGNEGEEALAVQHGDPERPESQVEDEHNDDTCREDASRRQALLIEEKSVDHTGEKGRECESREKGTAREEYGSDDVANGMRGAGFPRTVQDGADDNGKKSETDAKNRGVHGQKAREDDVECNQNRQRDELMCFGYTKIRHLKNLL